MWGIRINKKAKKRLYKTPDLVSEIERIRLG
jgi:hypothetical protein